MNAKETITELAEEMYAERLEMIDAELSDELTEEVELALWKNCMKHARKTYLDNLDLTPKEKVVVAPEGLTGAQLRKVLGKKKFARSATSKPKHRPLTVNDWQKAEEIAKDLEPSTYRRVSPDSPLRGLKDKNGRAFVVADTNWLIPDPDAHFDDPILKTRCPMKLVSHV